jgi:hypothetical protein
MNSYEGPATLRSDGNDFDVHTASLVSRGRQGWSGILRLGATVRAQTRNRVFGAMHTEIEMPSGRVGLVMVMRETDEGFEIRGYGGPPF